MTIFSWHYQVVGGQKIHVFEVSETARIEVTHDFKVRGPRGWFYIALMDGVVHWQGTKYYDDASLAMAAAQRWHIKNPDWWLPVEARR